MGPLAPPAFAAPGPQSLQPTTQNKTLFFSRLSRRKKVRAFLVVPYNINNFKKKRKKLYPDVETPPNALRCFSPTNIKTTKRATKPTTSPPPPLHRPKLRWFVPSSAVVICIFTRRIVFSSPHPCFVDRLPLCESRGEDPCTTAIESLNRSQAQQPQHSAEPRASDPSCHRCRRRYPCLRPSVEARTSLPATTTTQRPA